MRVPKGNVRQTKAAVLGIALSLAMVLVIICLGLFALSLFFGGQRETQTASDAGALNVGNKSVNLSVQLLPGEETNNFSDILNNGTSVSLSNINLCWAKAWMMALNADLMQKSNTLGSAATHVQQLHDDVEAISARLCKVLKNGDNLSTFYNQYAALNPVHMMGAGNTVQVPTTSNWSQSYLDTGYEGNVWITNAQIPIYSIIAQPPVPTVTSKNDPKQNTFLMGYTPYNVMSQNYWQVPFRFGERTHLIAKSKFDQSQTSTPSLWPNAPPNAFSTIGTTSTDRDLRLLAASWVQGTTPNTFPVRMPLEYLKVHLHRTVLNWVVNGTQVQSDTYLWPYYDQNSGTAVYPQKDFGPFDVSCGSVSAHETLGQEYMPNGLNVFLNNTIFTLQPNVLNDSALWRNLTQRMSQIEPRIPDQVMIWFTSGSLDEFVGAAPYADSDQEVVVNSRGIIGNSMKNPCPDPDGTPVLMEVEQLQSSPNYGTVTLTCPGKAPVTYPTVTMEQGERWWTPGSGYASALTPGVWAGNVGGCLGRVDIYRTTTVYISAF